ncbi:IclR family transcriptional regulator [Alkalimonas sp. MEB108]|uniref:IclR family transcriptional regulator n=1 Tax=Alkalimonas cellulosilytica TaxID=3058395 RepID=A0ABU7J128_9GAMM|nr:IclR family transcriptional regulator [Alkalimonas sp. MEB108]MEE2000201.1 IclR family transcriptional regulator [Alkalimonas sp. MEB108]
MMVSYVIPNLANACRMIDEISRAEQGLSLSELEQQLAVPRTTAFRILQTLCQQQLIEKHGKKYLAGSQLLRLGLSLLSSMPVKQKALPMLQQLSLSTGFSCHLALPHADGSLLVEVCDSPNPLRLAARPGTVVPLNCSASGKVFLAFRCFDRLHEPALQASFVRRTEHSLLAGEALKSELQRVLARGYATDEQEYHPDVRCLAAPVRDELGQVAAAVGVSAPAILFKKQQIQQIAAQVKQAAIEISLATYRPQLMAMGK